MRYFYWLLIIKSCFLMVVLNLDMEYICTAKTLINVVEEGSYYQIKFFAANKTSLKNYFLAEVIEQNLKLTSNCFLWVVLCSRDGEAKLGPPVVFSLHMDPFKTAAYKPSAIDKSNKIHQDGFSIQSNISWSLKLF